MSLADKAHQARQVHRALLVQAVGKDPKAGKDHKAQVAGKGLKVGKAHKAQVAGKDHRDLKAQVVDKDHKALPSSSPSEG